MLVKCIDGFLDFPHTEFDLRKTMSCGQSFRWIDCTADSKLNIYFGVSGKHKILVKQYDLDTIQVSCTMKEFDFWYSYFDFDTDYSNLIKFAGNDKFFAKCLDFGKGLRVLKHDLWEIICTFILSQRSNIPKIQSSLEKLVVLCGSNERFPNSKQLIKYSVDEISQFTRCGYRAPYLVDAAQWMNKQNDIKALHDMPYSKQKETLMQIKGVGDKVADCIILFGLHNREAFPVDVWIERVIEQKYDGAILVYRYGAMAGIVQQYIFHYVINHKEEFINDNL